MVSPCSTRVCHEVTMENFLMHKHPPSCNWVFNVTEVHRTSWMNGLKTSIPAVTHDRISKLIGSISGKAKKQVVPIRYEPLISQVITTYTLFNGLASESGKMIRSLEVMDKRTIQKEVAYIDQVLLAIKNLSRLIIVDQIKKITLEFSKNEVDLMLLLLQMDHSIKMRPRFSGKKYKIMPERIFKKHFSNCIKQRAFTYRQRIIAYKAMYALHAFVKSLKAYKKNLFCFLATVEDQRDSLSE